MFGVFSFGQSAFAFSEEANVEPIIAVQFSGGGGPFADRSIYILPEQKAASVTVKCSHATLTLRSVAALTDASAYVKTCKTRVTMKNSTACGSALAEIQRLSIVSSVGSVIATGRKSMDRNALIKLFAFIDSIE